MREYMRIVDEARNFLASNHYCSTIVNSNEQCFIWLGDCLTKAGCDYTPETADMCFAESLDRISPTERPRWRQALLRLREIYEKGQVRPGCRSKDTVLPAMRSDLDNFLDYLRLSLSPLTVENYERSCVQFLLFVQNSGASRLQDISFEMMDGFTRVYPDIVGRERGAMYGRISSMMAFFFKQDKVPYGFSILFHFLSLGKGYFWNGVSAEGLHKISELCSSTETRSVKELVIHKDVLLQAHRESGYTKGRISGCAQALDALALFLEMNGFEYSPKIASLWYSSIRNGLTSSMAYNYHRAICQLEDCFSDTVCLEKSYKAKPGAFYRLPQWCMEAAELYVDEKKDEGWAKSTLDMIRSSICRFCNYLDSVGIRSFGELEVSHIKQFNAYDVHRTPQGKNAYNTRIRKFLIFLGERGYLKNPMLFVALARTNAPKETIVVVLTEEEMNQLNAQLADPCGDLSLRKKAMLLLGLRLGLRSSDIVNLQIDNINWETATIRFMQKKTAVEVELPMSNEVGNALFRYITEERGTKPSPFIFLSENAPHKPINRGACYNALKAALPDRHVEGSGFHVTRKTFATNLLRNGVGAGIVAEVLGQRGTDSVHRYLSLDEERMRMCSLSLSDYGIGGWNDGE